MPGHATTPTSDDELAPRPAVVVPRGRRLDGQASLPIDRMLLPLIHSRSSGIVMITAPPGGGKTIALRHLHAVLPPDAQVSFFDAHQAADARQAGISGLIVLAGVDPKPGKGFADVIALSPWTLDDCLEYLVAFHRPQCASVLSRLKDDPSLVNLGGSPQFLTIVMDAMAGDPTLKTSWEIVRHHIHQIIPPGMALDRLILDGPLHAPLSNEQWRWWRHDEVKRICSADWIAGQLCKGVIPAQLHNMDDGAALVADIAGAVRHQPAAIACLERFLVLDRGSNAAPMTASILLAANPDWRPTSELGRNLNLSGALLSGARWSGLNLSGCMLRCTRLAGADLTGVNLYGAVADCADFTGAKLRGSRLEKTSLANSNLAGADLFNASASKADFSEVNFEGADLRNGIFRGAIFAKASMNNVRADLADFGGAFFSEVDFAQAKFRGAKFNKTKLQDIDMTVADWTAACFKKAVFCRCSLERLEILDVDFDGADLTGCLLTASRINRGKFRGTNLTNAGLADIVWPNADLRDANFTGASFHMGSSRSGLVGSAIPSEGSKTGFYTDDFNDQSYKPPEEIRKACLYGANLVGAVVERTDFYLVDLRRAVYSNAQAEHFSKSGAILESCDERAE
jgi:uncharacterized protein YjbI with pentapeptide repeats